MSHVMKRQVEITIGWTKSDHCLDYSSFMDGYRVGAAQHEETITVTVPREWTPEQVAEAVFIGTNAQEESTPGTPAAAIYQAVQATGYRGREAHFSLSVGDTVTIGEVRLACDKYGWRWV